jgi:hypothetical protein
LIERAYTEGEAQGLCVCTEDEAGPFQAIPQPGSGWHEQGRPHRLPHEYIRGGTAKLLTLFHPATGQVRAKGTRTSANAVLHPWLMEQLEQILSEQPPREGTPSEAESRAEWESWYEGLLLRPTLPERLPRLRMLLVLDNLKGHKSKAFVLWCFQHGIALLYTPLGGSWLNMTESLQRILVRRALEGTHPKSADEVIRWLEAAVRGWNAGPTPFVWGGKRAERRRRQRARRLHALGGSGACTRWRPLRRRPAILDHWQRSRQLTH